MDKMKSRLLKSKIGWRWIHKEDSTAGFWSRWFLRFSQRRSLDIFIPGVKRNFWPIIVCQLFCFTE